jgi:4-azaleucine resistance transporter AzlC
MSAVPSTNATGPGAEHLPERSAINRAAAGIGIYAGMFGLAFGAVAVSAGLSVAQAIALSALMFTGASQFALVGILGAAGSPFAAVGAALLLGMRNAFYGVPVAGIVRPRGLRRLLTAHLVIDETTAMAVAQPGRDAGRHAFWATGLCLCAMWNVGTLLGALIGSSISTRALGLDAAAPAIFMALLWPQLSRERGVSVAAVAAVVALALVAIAPAGVPIISAAGVAVAGGLLPGRAPRRNEEDAR